MTANGTDEYNKIRAIQTNWKNNTAQDHIKNNCPSCGSYKRFNPSTAAFCRYRWRHAGDYCSTWVCERCIEREGYIYEYSKKDHKITCEFHQQQVEHDKEHRLFEFKMLNE